MSTYVSGVPSTVSAQFLADGVLTDPILPVTFTVEPSEGGGAILMTTGVTHTGTGVFSYLWTPPAVDEATDYLLRWDGTGAEDIPAAEVVTVLPGTAGTWASAAEVLAITGQTRDADTVVLASSMIETYSGAQVDMPDAAITDKDRRHLARATAWQAAWLTPARIANIVTEREGAKSVSADNVRIERNTMAETMLAPMAIRELKSLSWVGTRSVRPMPRSRRSLAWDSINFINERSDPLWMGGPL
jgi:hypothetical protein